MDSYPVENPNPDPKYTRTRLNPVPTRLYPPVPTRGPEVWCNWDLCEMSDGSSKARCKFCGALLAKESNTTLKKHITKFCKGKKENPDFDQTQIGVDRSIRLNNSSGEDEM
ncbi:hypothetical protein R6Q57_026837 [Mikania cordata]